MTRPWKSWAVRPLTKLDKSASSTLVLMQPARHARCRTAHFEHLRNACVSYRDSPKNLKSVTMQILVLTALLSLAGSFQHATPLRRPHTLRALLEVTDEYGFVDEAATLQANRDRTGFPIAPDDLIAKAKEVIIKNQNLQDPAVFDDSIYADNFRFVAPFVGGATSTTGERIGFTKAEFLASLRSFDLLKAFPNLNNRYHAFRVDVFEPNRVWFQTRAKATHTGELMGASPTGKSLELPPEALSMTFNADGQVELFTVGYVIDRTAGNTGGLGGAFGYFWGTGNPLPFPECQPFKGSIQLRLLGALQKLLPTPE